MQPVQFAEQLIHKGNRPDAALVQGFQKSANCQQGITTMPKKSLKVDRKTFEGIVQSLLQSKPMKREKVKIAKKKPAKLIPPQR